jgi:hypothetical protein
MPVDEMLATPALSHKEMPYVVFKTETIPDPVRTKTDGVYRCKDQDYAVITVPGDKGNNIDKIEAFFEKKEQELKIGRVHPEWIRKWRNEYALYQQGQAIPEDGTPIKGWKLITGAQQEEFLRMNVRTVEALANLSDDGVRNFGMGAIELKRRAQAWVAQNGSVEAGALKLAEVTRQVDSLLGQVKALTEKNDELEKAVQRKK